MEELIKRIFCIHEYVKVSDVMTVTGTRRESTSKIVKYKCKKCGKTKFVTI